MTERIERAERIVEALRSEGLDARVWQGDEHVRVYVSRTLSRRRQDMGYIEVTDAGIESGGLDRARARVTRIAESA